MGLDKVQIETQRQELMSFVDKYMTGKEALNKQHQETIVSILITEHPTRDTWRKALNTLKDKGFTYTSSSKKLVGNEVLISWMKNLVIKMQPTYDFTNEDKGLQPELVKGQADSLNLSKVVASDEALDGRIRKMETTVGRMEKIVETMYEQNENMRDIVNYSKNQVETIWEFLKNLDQVNNIRNLSWGESVHKSRYTTKGDLKPVPLPVYEEDRVYEATVLGIENLNKRVDNINAKVDDTLMRIEKYNEAMSKGVCNQIKKLDFDVADLNNAIKGLDSTFNNPQFANALEMVREDREIPKLLMMERLQHLDFNSEELKPFIVDRVERLSAELAEDADERMRKTLVIECAEDPIDFIIHYYGMTGPTGNSREAIHFRTCKWSQPLTDVVKKIRSDSSFEWWNTQNVRDYLDSLEKYDSAHLDGVYLNIFTPGVGNYFEKYYIFMNDALKEQSENNYKEDECMPLLDDSLKNPKLREQRAMQIVSKLESSVKDNILAEARIDCATTQNLNFMKSFEDMLKVGNDMKFARDYMLFCEFANATKINMSSSPDNAYTPRFNEMLRVHGYHLGSNGTCMRGMMTRKEKGRVVPLNCNEAKIQTTFTFDRYKEIEKEMKRELGTTVYGTTAVERYNRFAFCAMLFLQIKPSEKHGLQPTNIFLDAGSLSQAPFDWKYGYVDDSGVMFMKNKEDALMLGYASKLMRTKPVKNTSVYLDKIFDIVKQGKLSILGRKILERNMPVNTSVMTIADYESDKQNRIGVGYYYWLNRVANGYGDELSEKFLNRDFSMEDFGLESWNKLIKENQKHLRPSGNSTHLDKLESTRRNLCEVAGTPKKVYPDSAKQVLSDRANVADNLAKTTGCGCIFN